MSALPFEDLPDPEPTPEPTPARYTEAHMLDLLHRRYSAVAMGARRYAVAEHVADQTSWASRRADFIAQDCYQGVALHGHEVKVSRSDWLRELADPTKAETFASYCDYWWLVVPDRSIVRNGELPEGWGLLAGGRQLRAVVAARRRAPEPMPPRMRAALLRATQATAAKRAEMTRLLGIDAAYAMFCGGACCERR